MRYPCSTLLLALATGVAATSALSAAPTPNVFLNLSTRGRVDSGENVLIGGLILETRANVLIRGMGPSLARFGVGSPLGAPRLTLYDKDGHELATNTDWRLAIPAALGPIEPPFPEYTTFDTPAAALRAVMSQVGAFQPSGFVDTALYAELPAGTYTVHLAAADGEPGVGLVESYLVPETIDAFPPAGRVRTAPEVGYAPVLDGLAPISPVPDEGAVTLTLNFYSPAWWRLGGATVLLGSTCSIPFEATGTRELQHGRAGALDTRGWLVSPRYTKTGPNTATVHTFATPTASSGTLHEEITLTFTSPSGGTFVASWKEVDGPSAGGNDGTFVWRRSAPEGSAPQTGGPFFRRFPVTYSDGRPSTDWGVEVADHGPVLEHGYGPDGSDANGAREAVVVAVGHQFVLHYDGCADGGWRACRAVSTHLLGWSRDGPVLELGAPGSIDEGTVASPWVIEDGGLWHMFYLAARQTTGAPDYVPMPPYVTRRATAPSIFGPWTKDADLVPFDPSPGTYYAATASPGHLLKHGGEFLQFFSAAATSPSGVLQRTLGLARTTDLAGTWAIDPSPLLPPTEQIENSSLYYEPANGLWFLFTNHVGVTPTGMEYTDEIWMYWSPDPTRFDVDHKAVVLDPGRSIWSKSVLGMPSVVRVDDRLAVLYDGSSRPGYSHMQRDIGLAWLDLPLQPPF
ncbi:MAG: hypothetical protein IAE82_17845 [Opitutaceae bacterium]|nr:hypothetical protein [Opitutaceae bacterium]